MPGTVLKSGETSRGIRRGECPPEANRPIEPPINHLIGEVIGYKQSVLRMQRRTQSLLPGRLGKAYQ